MTGFTWGTDAVWGGSGSEGRPRPMVSSLTPLWAELSFEESRDVVAALARLGFAYDPAAGWGAGRVPAHNDLTVALGYAGLDTFDMRGLLDGAALAELPRTTIGVDARHGARCPCGRARVAGGMPGARSGRCCCEGAANSTASPPEP